jgi:integrase/recombinase XerD
MKTPKVRLYIRVRVAPGQYSFAEPVWNKNRSLRGGYAHVKGQPEYHPEGLYYLRFLRGSKRVWQVVGADADAALVALRNTEHDLQAVTLGRSVYLPVAETEAPVEAAQPSIMLEDAVASYLSEVRRFRSLKTIAACERILRVFGSRFPQRSLASIQREDLLEHMAALQAEGLGPRTIYNHVMRLKTFFRSQGTVGLLKREDIPAYDEREVEAYDADQLDDLFAAASSEERLLFQFFLATGLRDQEVRYCTWRNVDFNGKVITVRSKPELGFRPKDKEERSVPVPDSLIALLERRKRASSSPFLFPGKNGKPDGHFLRTLQSLAHRAGLNCGECVNKKKQSCLKHAICGGWGLHKFRKTFATMHSEAGVPAPTIQRWLGHSDLATTLRYLAIADLRSERTRQQVNATFAGLNTERRVHPPLESGLTSHKGYEVAKVGSVAQGSTSLLQSSDESAEAAAS